MKLVLKTNILTLLHFDFIEEYCNKKGWTAYFYEKKGFDKDKGDDVLELVSNPHKNIIEKPFTYVSRDNLGKKIYFDELFNNQSIVDFDLHLPRDDSDLIELIEENKHPHLPLGVVEIPDDIEYDIMQHDDGREWVAEKHRTWYVERVNH